MNVTLIIAGAVVLLALIVMVRARSGSRNIDVDFDRPTEADFQALLAAGRKIDAIKVYRRLHGVDLKTAKETVERIAAGLPPPARG